MCKNRLRNSMWFLCPAGSLAIGITLNLVYHGTKEEAAIPEVSGLAYHFKPEFFDKLYQRHGVRLENFVYYKGETHYFVMTAVKSSLIARGALLMVGLPRILKKVSHEVYLTLFNQKYFRS